MFSRQAKEETSLAVEKEMETKDFESLRDLMAPRYLITQPGAENVSQVLDKCEPSNFFISAPRDKFANSCITFYQTVLE